MTMTVAFMVLMQAATTQFLVSTKAGLVNYVQGSANVKAATSVPPGAPIATGPNGLVEVLLNPGSYLRLGENSQAILERVELTEIAVRIVQGSAVIEANGVDKDLPLKVTSGNLKMDIIKDGIYLFSDGKVVVVDGKVRDGSNGLIYGKGYMISDDQGYRAQKVKTFTTSLETWSQKRDELISQANMNIANSLRQRSDLPLSSFLDVWLWYPAIGSFVYMPGGRYRSPYGYRYYTVGDVYYGGGGGGGYGNSASSGGGGSSASSAGGGGGGGSFSSSVSASGGSVSSPTPSAGAQSGAPVGRSTAVAP